MILLLPILILLCISGCSLPDKYRPMEEGAYSVFIRVDGWHTGIILLAEQCPARLIPERLDFPGSKYFEFGWGDERFYMTPGFDPYLAARALFWETSSVMHVVAFDDHPKEYFLRGELYEIGLKERSFVKLCRFLSDSFARRSKVSAQQLGKGYYESSAFYPSPHKYDLFHTCNVWAASALKAAGCPITPWKAITSSGLTCQLMTFAKRTELGETRAR